MPNKIPTFRPKGFKQTTRQPDTRPSSGARGYDAQWQKFRLQVIRDHVQTFGPYCSECRAPLDFGRFTHVDHVQPFTSLDDPRRFDPDNCRVICQACHNRKTRREKRHHPGGVVASGSAGL